MSIFLDYASATPLDPQVFKKMKPYFTDAFYNPSSLYKESVAVRAAVEDAREKIARTIGCRTDEIIFTSGGTESINIALRGVVEAYHAASSHASVGADGGVVTGAQAKLPHIITSAIEHPAVLETCRYLERKNIVSVTYLSPDENGIIQPESVEAVITDQTILITLMYVNNEIGSINPLRDISRAIHAWKKNRGRSVLDYPCFHTDASQAPNYVDIRKESIGVDMMTLDASKIYGPKGVGILFKKQHVPMTALMQGGSQERSLRAGTENVPLIIGCAEALVQTVALREKESARIADIRNYCFTEIVKVFPTATLNGPAIDVSITSTHANEQRVPHNLNICIPGMYAEFAVIQLDAAGIACSSVTACRTPDEETSSHVIDALDKVRHSNCARSSLRISFGRGSRKSDIKPLIKALQHALEKAPHRVV